MSALFIRGVGFAGALILYGLVFSLQMGEVMPPIDPLKNPMKPAAAKATPSATEASTGGGNEISLSFELKEKVSAQAPIVEADKKRLAAQKFPPMRFRWNSAVSALAPAFLLEAPDGRIFLGERLVGGDEVAILGRYSEVAAIRAPDGRLRLHLTVAARLTEWVQKSSDQIANGETVEIAIEPKMSEGAVAFRMPAVGNLPARTLLVTL